MAFDTTVLDVCVSAVLHEFPQLCSLAQIVEYI